MAATWICVLSDDTSLRVPDQVSNNENVLRFGIQALMRRMMRSWQFIAALTERVTIKYFKNIQTGEVIQFEGTHAGLIDVLCAKFPIQTHFVEYRRVDVYYGHKTKHDKRLLDLHDTNADAVNHTLRGFSQDIYILDGRTKLTVVSLVEDESMISIEHTFTFIKKDS